MMAALAGIAVTATLLCGSLFLRNRALRAKYGGIADAEATAVSARRSAESVAAEAEHTRQTNERELQALQEQHRTVKAHLDDLNRQVALVEENLEDISFGLYKPHFTFTDSDEYKARLDRVRGVQKEMVRAGRAVRFLTSWTVGGSRSEGERMQKQYMKLMLLAFNGECDANVANVSWNNVTRMEERIARSFTAINKLGSVMTVAIEPAYRDLKLEELRLKYELEERLHLEKEEARRHRAQLKEEEKARREIERAREEAEEDEARYEAALEEARADAGRAEGAKLDALQARIAELEERVRLAQEGKQRALSRAQLTRSGHVYIISNIGSFGERVVKIGLTRRLKPLERIKELSDASVPFDFDVHAILYSEDAPALEAKFHQAFADRRINLVNERKEFFSVAVDDVETFMRDQGLTAVITKMPEARHYRETITLRARAREDEERRASLLNGDTPRNSIASS
jgi:hypothetical protein